MVVSSDYYGAPLLFSFFFFDGVCVCVHASMHDSCLHYVYVCVFRTKRCVWFLPGHPEIFWGTLLRFSSFMVASDRLSAVMGCLSCRSLTVGRKVAHVRSYLRFSIHVGFKWLQHLKLVRVFSTTACVP